MYSSGLGLECVGAGPPDDCAHLLPCWPNCFYSGTDLPPVLSCHDALTWRLLAGLLHLVGCTHRGWVWSASGPGPPMIVPICCRVGRTVSTAGLTCRPCSPATTR